MSALLSFAWRNRRQESPKREASNDNLYYNHHRTFQPHSSPVPPAITASQSSDASVVTPLYLPATVIATDDFICIPRRRGGLAATPSTPEGLKPRRSIADLRDELFFDSHRSTTMIPDILQPRPSVHQIREKLISSELIVSHAKTTKESSVNEEQAATSTQIRDRALVVPVKKTVEAENVDTVGQLPRMKALEAEDVYNHQQLSSIMEHRSISVLPPRPSRSWSTEGAWSSPTPASQYSASTLRTTPSAQSPHLIPGQARTAVGNLVALQNNNNGGREETSLVEYQEIKSPQAAHVVKYDDDWNYSPQEEYVDSMFSPMFSRDGRSVASMKSSKSLPNPLPVNISSEDMFSPLSRKSVTKALPPPRSDTIFSPVSRTSSAQLVAAPQQQNSGVISDDMFSPLSRSSTTKPLAKAKTFSGTANPPLVKAEERETEIVLSSKRHSSNWSTTRGCDPSVPSTLSRSISADDNLVFHALDSDLKRIKQRNQLRAKEELILAALERLQDNIDLVGDVEALMGSTEGMFDWFVRTPLDKEGLLTGFSEVSRVVCIAKLDKLLNELHADIPTGEYFLSPSKASMPEFEEAHDDLHDALMFCKVLVQMAIPEEEKEDSSLQGTEDVGRWTFLPGLRFAIGVGGDEADTPEARGGDSSFFSLPQEECEAETPMTSNVSLGASTLTTLPTANAATPNRNNTLHERLKLQNGLQLRQAIQVFTTGLQKITESCSALSKLEIGRPSRASKLVLATENIKQSYFQLLAMNHNDLRSLVDAFEFELESDEDSYVYEDTDGDDDSIGFTKSSTIAMGTIQSSEVSDYRRREVSFDKNGRSSPPLFRSEYALTPPPEEEPFEYDDLRRRVGSNEYCIGIEEREGCPRESPGSSDSCQSERLEL